MGGVVKSYPLYPVNEIARLRKLLWNVSTQKTWLSHRYDTTILNSSCQKHACGAARVVGAEGVCVCVRVYDNTSTNSLKPRCG